MVTQSQRINNMEEIEFWRNKAHEYERLAQEQRDVASKYKELYLELMEMYKGVTDCCKRFNEELRGKF